MTLPHTAHILPALAYYQSDEIINSFKWGANPRRTVAFTVTLLCQCATLIMNILKLHLKNKVAGFRPVLVQNFTIFIILKATSRTVN